MTNNVAPAYENRNGFQASDNLFRHSEQRDNSRRIRVTVPAEWSGTKRAITRYDWSQSLSLSRQLFASVGELAGAYRQKSTYVIGDSWQPQHQGTNHNWGRETAEWIDSWFEVANIRGEPFDFVTSLFVDSIGIDRDGDSAMACIIENGEPRLQFFPAHRIGFRNVSQNVNGYGIVPPGTRFSGAKTYNGVIFDRLGRVIGYNVMGEEIGDDRQFSVAECQLLYEPDWADQGRGIPAIATSLLHMMDYEDIHHFLKRQVKMDSAQGIMHYNEEGAAEDTRDFIEGKTNGEGNQDVKIETLEGNEMMYFKALGGGKLEAFRSDRPHPNVDAYTMRILRASLLAAGWFYELYDPSQVGGASTRLIQDMARATIRRRARLMYKRWIRAVVHGVTWAMQTGAISRNDQNDWLKWSPTLPSKLTVDARYDDKTRMERIKMAGGTYAQLFAEEGLFWEDEITQRAKEQRFIEDVCKQFGVDPEKVQLLTPNGNMQQGASDGETDTPTEKRKTK